MAASVVDSDDSLSIMSSFILPDDEDVFVRMWQQTIRKCREKMYSRDYERVMQKISPETLEEELRLKEVSDKARPWMVTITPECSNSGVVETSILWGLLRLIVDMSLTSGERWAQTTRILKTVRRILEKCKTSAEIFGHSEELKQSFLDVMVALVTFWAGASKIMRQITSVDSATEKIDALFTIAEKEMNDAVTSFREYTAIKAAGSFEYRSIKQDQQGGGRFLDRENFPANGQHKERQLHQLPYHNISQFVGREDVLARIGNALDPDDVSTSQKYFTIWGLGGIGKSQTALAYATQNKHKFDATFWVRAETVASLHQSFTDLAIHLQVQGASRSKSHEDNRDYFHSWLLLSGLKWLMVFDNVEDIDNIRLFWPSAEGSLLVTTRRIGVAAASRGTNETKYALKSMNLAEGRQLFKSLLRGSSERPEWQEGNELPDEESQATETLLSFLGGLPLGIRQAAALIKIKNLNVSAFLRRYMKAAGDTTKFFRNGNGKFSFDLDYQHLLDTVWKMSFQDLSNEHDGSAYKLLAVVSLCSPDVIPLDIFTQKDFKYHTWLDICNDRDEDDFHLAKEDLIEAALINQETGELSIHRLVQTAFLNQLTTADLQQAFDAAALAFHHLFPKQVDGKPLVPQWEQREKYSQHVISICIRWAQLKIKHNLHPETKFIEMLSNCAWYLYESGDWPNCELVLGIAKDCCVDKDGLLFAHLLNTTGCRYFDLNMLSLCRENWQAALNIRLRLLPVDDEDLRCTWNNLANAESADGNYDRALQLFEDVRQSRSLSATKSFMTLTYSGMARAMRLKSDFEGAELYWNKVNEILINEVVVDAHFNASWMMEYGDIARGKGDLPKALHHYKQSSTLFLTISPRHIFNAALFYKIGRVQHELGQLEDANDSLQKAYEIAKEKTALGEIARIMHRQSLVIQQQGAQGDAQEAMRLSNMAEVLKSKLEKEGMSPIEGESLNLAYDRLVGPFFR